MRGAGEAAARDTFMQSATQGFPSRLSSDPQDLHRYAWAGGSFTTARRVRTEVVEGEINATNHLVMATFGGGARRHEIRTDDGCRFDGADRPGSVSFLPARRSRRLRLQDVEWRWGALAIEPSIKTGEGLDGLSSFVVQTDAFILAMLREFDRLSALDGGLDPLWCEQMVAALVAYLGRSQSSQGEDARPASRLPAWQLRKLREHVEAHLSAEILMSDLATLCGLSGGHFHRAFKATTGSTPLQFVTARRVETARRLLAQSDFSIDLVAFKVGFVSPSHFARVFRQGTGQQPAEYRRGCGLPR